MSYAFAKAIDAGATAEALASDGRVQIRGALESTSAEQLATELAAIREWDFALTDPRQGPYKITHQQLITQAPPQRARMLEDLRRQARAGYACAYYRRDVLPGEARVLPEFGDWLENGDFVGRMREITGVDSLLRSDAHATRYQPGSFLKRHDDTYSGKRRRFAWVLNLTREWEADWGGLLHFEDDAGEVTACLMPHFNSLSIFAVPQAHHVSQVATYARNPRDAITGWLFDE